MRITKAKLKQMIKEELEDNTDEYMISSTIHIHLQNMVIRFRAVVFN